MSSEKIDLRAQTRLKKDIRVTGRCCGLTQRWFWSQTKDWNHGEATACVVDHVTWDPAEALHWRLRERTKERGHQESQALHPENRINDEG